MSTRYDRSYAERYRAHDDELDSVEPYRDLVSWLRDVVAPLPRGYTALDLGCGTGRYFWAIDGAAEIVGLDESAAMLEEARRPVHADRIAARVRLVQGDLAAHEFAPEGFDLVYAVGVLAEHTPLDEAVVARVRRWLRRGGRFAFTTVHPDSPSIPQTLGRRLARGATMVAPVRTRLLSGGRYADERRIRELLSRGFAIERLERFQSEAHLHCRAVGRKT